MRLLFAFLIAAIACLQLGACSTPAHRALEKVKMGMAKDEVLEIAGNPRRTRRWKGSDEWIYVYYVDGQEKNTELHFHQGRVVFKKERIVATDYKTQMDRAKNLEEFEYRAKAYKESEQYQQDKQSDFEDVEP